MNHYHLMYYFPGHGLTTYRVVAESADHIPSSILHYAIMVLENPPSETFKKDRFGLLTANFISTETLLDWLKDRVGVR